MLVITVLEWALIVSIFIVGLAVFGKWLESENPQSTMHLVGFSMIALAIGGVGAVTHGGSLVVPIFESLLRVGTML